MRLAQILLPITFLVSHVVADGASISAAIDNIAAATEKLNETVAGFPNNPILGLTDIGDLLVNSVGALKAINDGTKVAEASANLTTAEAIGLAGKIQTLASTVTTTLDTTKAAKSKFDKLLIVSPIVLLNLKQQRTATVEFGDAVISKVPVELQPIAQNLQAPILAALDAAIDYYNPF
ncbi:antigenic cell wall galactomannoprotein-like protein [Cadophora sp. MPI-SDFR-AT-0126]|nr:antigenic cell wall galactomannoprotein-like protein [Leotiomycetes sp. MPI-SDFR-AT-0126]